jgi:hypothetical protein
MAKKPWRTLHVGEDTGRFTREQIAQAIKAARERTEGKSRNGVRPRNDGVEASGPKRCAPFMRKPASVPAAGTRPKNEA